MAELSADRIEPGHYQVLVAPLEFVLGPPVWWKEPGARNLFLELLATTTIADARSSVAALV